MDASLSSGTGASCVPCPDGQFVPPFLLVSLMSDTVF